jgi:hypothetical protein
MDDGSWPSGFLTRASRGILQPACVPESRETQIDPTFLLLPWSPDKLAHTAAPQDEAGRHFDPSKLQQFVDLTLASASTRRSKCEVPDSSKPSCSPGVPASEKHILFLRKLQLMSPTCKCDQHKAWHRGKQYGCVTLCLTRA